MTTRRPALPYDPALDGLRGVAVAGVLAFHLGAGWAGGGFLGVSAFFTLSGFLITSLLLAEHAADGSVDLGAFWVRRIRRLQPLAVVTLFGVVVYTAAVAASLEVEGIRGDVVASLAQVANWHFILDGRSYADLFVAPSPVQHFWSLGLEEQLYVALPLVVVGVLRLARGRRPWLFAAFAAAAVVSTWRAWDLYVPASSARAYYGTDTRAAEVLVGAALAVLLRRSAAHWKSPARTQLAGLAAGAAVLVTWVIATPASPWLYRGGLLGHALLVALVITVARRPGPLRSATSWRPLVALGGISYAVYLVHWPVLLWLSPERTGLDGPVLLGLRLGAIAGLAVLGHRLVEQPIRLGARLTGRRAGLRAMAAPAAVLAGVVLVGVARPAPSVVYEGTAAPSPPPAPMLRASTVETSADARSHEALSAPVASAPPVPARVLLVGDSVGAALGAGFEAWGQATGLAQVWNAGRQYCGIGRGGLVEWSHLPPAEFCDQWPERWAGHLDEFDPDIVLVLSTVWDMSGRMQPGWGEYLDAGDPVYDAWLLDEYTAAFDLLSSTGARVVWFTIPCQSDPRPAAARWTRAVNEGVLPDLVRRRPRLELVDLFGEVCPGGEFSNRYRDEPEARPDGIHFSINGATAVAEVLGPSIVAGG